jgi:hypothetical protein
LDGKDSQYLVSGADYNIAKTLTVKNDRWIKKTLPLCFSVMSEGRVKRPGKALNMGTNHSSKE